MERYANKGSDYDLIMFVFISNFRVEAFSQENNDLKKKVDSLENNNRSLLSQLQKLQSLVGKVTGRPAGGSTQTGTVLMVRYSQILYLRLCMNCIHV